MHDLRASFVTNMRKAGVEISEIMTFTGHKDETMLYRYNRNTEDDQTEAQKKIERWMTKAETGTANVSPKVSQIGQ